jgi:uncharacterized phage protein gp47/JayE
MPFTVPSLGEIAQRTANAFRADLKGSDARLWPNNLAVASKVIAGALWPAYAFIEYVGRQAFAHLADGQFLERHGAEFGMARLPATYAEGSVVLSGDNGTVVAAGVVLRRADGVEYETTTSGAVAAGGVTLKARSRALGRTGNALSGVALTLTAPLDRIQSSATVASTGIGGGADVESDESYRARILFRKRNPPHGGAAHDYVQWAREINGVTRVYVDPVTAANDRTTVGVWFLMDNTYANGVPQSADVARVAAYIDTLRPAGALVSVAAPTAVAVNITITGLSPDTTLVRESILAELRSMFRREVRVSTLTDPFTLHRSLISEAISIATGEHHHTLTAPASDVTYSAGQIATLGTVTFA